MCNDSIMRYIEGRRSVRKYTEEPVGPELLEGIIDAARYAPSGLNNQPWRFVTVENRKILDALAKTTKYKKVLEGCQAAIAVFLDTSKIYHREKDIQSIGAAIENMLLAAHGMGLGACWLGEILNNREEVERILEVSSEMELMAVIALGFPVEGDSAKMKERLPLEEVVLSRF